MKLLGILSLSLAVAAATVQRVFLAGENYNVGHITLGPMLPRQFPDSELPCRMLIFYPLKNGSYPVTIFLGGMFGSLPTEWYTDLLSRMAAVGKGSVVIAMDLHGYLPADYVDASNMFEKVMDWAISSGSRLNGRLPFGVELDTSKLVIASHSSGAQAAMTLWRRRDADVSSLVFFDPVDAMGDDFRQTQVPVFPPFTLSGMRQTFSPPPTIDPSIPDQLISLKQPVLVVSTGLCHIPAVHLPPPSFLNMSRIRLPPIFDGASLWPACCPKNLGPERFWKAISFPWDVATPLHRMAWHWNFTSYGHCDVLDDKWVWTNRLMRFCRSIVDDRLLDNRRDHLFDLSSLRHSISSLFGAFLDVAVHGNKTSTRILQNSNWTSDRATIQFN